MACAIDSIRTILEDHGIDAKAAALICAEISDAIGGGRVYIGVRAKSAYAARNAEIVANFTGNNHRDLAMQHGVTRNRIYKIVETRKK
jgi:Mor family transcriptional regulator